MSERWRPDPPPRRVRSLPATLLAATLLAAAALNAASPSPDDPTESSLLQVIVTAQPFDPILPWLTGRPSTRFGYGVVVGPGQVLTTESLVRNHRLVELRRPQTGEKIPAVVETSDYQVNAALLRPVDPDTLHHIPPLPLADHLPRRAPVQIRQFDSTGQVQDDAGQILQVSMDKLPEAPFPCLTFSVLTDLNVTGQGAAVIHDGKLAGLMMSYDRGSRTGDMLPYPVLSRFLRDVAEPPYEGFASAGFVWTSLVDPAKRRFLNVMEPARGILILACLAGAGASETLHPNDVILELDGHAVDNLGFYHDEDFGRLSLAYLIKGRHQPGDLVPVQLVRNRHVVSVELQLSQPDDNGSLIPENIAEEQPEYLVEGGLLLQELTGRYLRAFGPNWDAVLDPRLVHLYLTRKYDATNVGDRVVILSRVLPDPINVGYQHFQNEIVVGVNGEPVRNLRDVFRIRDRDGFLTRLSLQSIGVDLVLDPARLPEANARLSHAYRIPTLRHPSSTKSQDDPPPSHPDSNPPPNP